MIVYRSFGISKFFTSLGETFRVTSLMADGKTADEYLSEPMATLAAAERFIDGYLCGALAGLEAGRVLAEESRELMSPVFIPEAELPE